MIRTMLAVAALAALAGSPRDAAAVNFNVNDTTDLVDAAPGDGACATAAATCTLRAAVQEANALAGADQITLAAATYALTLNGAGENAAATGDLDITSNLTINGVIVGAAMTTIDAGNLAPRDRVFHVINAPAVLRRLKIRGGKENFGGGVLNDNGRVTLGQARIESNTADNDGGGVRSDGMNARLTVNNSTVSGNSAVDNGGGIANSNGSIMTVKGTTVTGNQCGDAGGGIYNFLAANALIDTSTLSLNTAAGVFSLGGGLANIDATADLEDTTVSDNTAGTGGGIYSDEDNFFSTLDTMFVTVSGNTATGAGGGGGIYLRHGDAMINLATVTGNEATAGNGGGMVVIPDSNTIEVMQTAVFENTASGDGGGISYLGEVGAAGNLLRCAIYQNTAGDDGGGVYVSQPGNMNMTFTKTTISGNTANGDGGGVYLSAGAGTFVSLGHLTVVDNDAARGGGIYVANAAASYTAYHVLLSDNTAGAGPNCDGSTLTSGGWNLVRSLAGCTFASLASDLIGPNPLLGPLQFNGGATWTHALLAGSPAIDTGNGVNCTAGGASDQRGMTMPVGECDIGAYERQ
jgi:predicted outer membrane repeat protein